VGGFKPFFETNKEESKSSYLFELFLIPLEE